MKYLFIDTSTHILTIAIATSDSVLGIITSDHTNEHSKDAVSKLEELFKELSMNPNEVDKLLVVNGPGSFTGVRIGVTIAKTYAWALEKDIAPISSLRSYALAYNNYDYYVSLLDARRKCVYAGIYNAHYEPILEEQYISIDKLNDKINSLKGSIAIIGDIDINDQKSLPIKLDVLKIIQYNEGAKIVPPHGLKPQYLKQVEAEEKLTEV